MISGKLKWIGIAALGLLLLLVLWFQPWSERKEGFEGLLLENRQRVTHIEIVLEFDTIVFQKEAGTWNMGGEVLNQKAVENLLIGAGRMTKQSIVPIAELKQAPAAIAFRFKEGKRTIVHFKFASDSLGYFIFRDAESLAYGIEIAGYEGFHLERIFSSNPNHYREHLLIDLLPDEVRLVRIEPISGTAFEARQDSTKDITIIELPSGNDLTEKMNEQEIRLLFSFFNAIRYEEQIPITEPRAREMEKAPMAVVEVGDFNGNTWKMQIFPWIKEGTSEADLFHALVKFSDPSSLLTVNYFHLDLLMRGLENYIDQKTIDI